MGTTVEMKLPEHQVIIDQLFLIPG